MWARALHLLLLGLFGAAIVHIVILFLVPVYSEQDIWSRLAAKADLYTPVGLNDMEPSSGRPSYANPFLEAAACRVDLSGGAARITAAGQVPFWSVSIYDRDGLNVFSLNDRSGGERLDVVVAKPTQMLEIRKAPPAEVEQSVFAEVDIGEGIVLARVFVPDESWRNTAAALLASMVCEPY